MANRHLSRSIALQALFEWDFNGCATKQLEPIAKRVAAEFAPGMESADFVDALTVAVASKRGQLDNIIGKAAPEWPLEQIAIVDRNVLRIGLYELLFADKKEVPARVAINEAIELAKTFGGEKSGRFVNGVLGAVYKEIGEPGKDEVPAKKRRIKNIPYEEMPIEKLGGAVVYTVVKEVIYLALVHDIFGYWTLSKGHLDEVENLEMATAREIKEEMGITITVEEALGLNEYIASDPDKGKLRKQVNYFLAKTEGKPALCLEKEKGGLDRVEWFPLAEISELKIYDDVLPIITKAINILTARLAAGTL